MVNAVATLRDETRTARDEAAQILEDVTAGAVPDSAVASKITAEGLPPVPRSMPVSQQAPQASSHKR
ncbi:hypothetical protein [Gordonia westfalica]|uniref:hypothetical protein n=1 Tax=Gordonia westfalica TaxID=158898 RepID=UPI0009452D3D|nr:hypothetical protein [Gordonia westfalica]